MQLSGLTLIVHLTGPRNRQEESGRWQGTSDISRVRLRETIRVARRRKCKIYAPIKKAELKQFKRDLEAVRKQHPFAEEDVIHEVGVVHTLANAWYALRYAYAHSYETLVVVTSRWHMPRVEHAFRELAIAIGVLMGRTIALEFVKADYSRRPSVRYFEKRVMERVERETKLPNERENVSRYVERLRETGLVEGFVPFPSNEFLDFSHDPNVTYQSVVEPDEEAKAG